MSLLSTQSPQGLKWEAIVFTETYGFCAFSPQVALITFHPHLVIIGNHLFLLVWSSGWTQHKAVLQRCWTGRSWTQHAHWWVVNKCNRQSTCIVDVDADADFWCWRHFSISKGKILSWWTIVIGRQSFVILWICLQVLLNSKAIRPSAVADSGDKTNWLWF